MVSGFKIRLMGMEATSGLMGANTMVNGKTTICMDTVFTFMRITYDTMASLSMIRNKATDVTNGLMDAGMRVGGTKVSNMVSAPTMTTRREM